MVRTTQYKTKQKQEILSFLQSKAGEKVTVCDILRHFEQCGISVGTATVYRHLEQLVSNGTVKKLFVDGMPGACFEYMDSDDSTGNLPFFFLKCEHCGRLIRFECQELAHIRSHLSHDHGFSIDLARTILYGTCDQCTR